MALLAVRQGPHHVAQKSTNSVCPRNLEIMDGNKSSLETCPVSLTVKPVFLLFNDQQPQHPLGMARIINAKEVLQIYAAAFPKDEMQLELSDKQLSVNNGYYYLCKGKCMYSTERLPGTHIQMNISELIR